METFLAKISYFCPKSFPVLSFCCAVRWVSCLGYPPHSAAQRWLPELSIRSQRTFCTSVHNSRIRRCKFESCNGMQHAKVKSAGERQAPHKRYRNTCLGKWKLPINLLQPLTCCCGAMSVRSQAYMFMHTHSCKCACVNVCMLASACMRLHAPARMYICKFVVGPWGAL